MSNPKRATCTYHLIRGSEYLVGMEIPWSNSMSSFDAWIKENNFEVTPDIWVIRSRMHNRAYRIVKSTDSSMWLLREPVDYPSRQNPEAIPQEIQVWANLLGIPLDNERY